jgi:hypothetical protein
MVRAIMLKLEKAVHSREITISLRNQEAYFNRAFFIAFAFAITVHLSAAMIFKIHTDSQSSKGQLKPIIVNSDLGYSNQDHHFSAIPGQANDRGLSPPRQIPKPELSVPTIPKFSLCSESSPGNEKCEISPLDFDYSLPAFTQLERLPYHPEEQLFFFSIPNETVSIEVSGPLARLPLIEEGLLSIKETLRDLPRATDSFFLSFEVQVDESSGLIFSSSLSGRPSREHEMLGEIILKSLKFSQTVSKARKHALTTAGVIDILVHIDVDQCLEALKSPSKGCKG